MKLTDARLAILDEIAKGIDVIKGVPAYDALKERVLKLTHQVFDVFDANVGDLEVDLIQQHQTAALLASVAGYIMGGLTKLELTEVDRKLVEEKGAEFIRQQIMREQLANREPMDLVGRTLPQDLN